MLYLLQEGGELASLVQSHTDPLRRLLHQKSPERSSMEILLDKDIVIFLFGAIVTLDPL